MIIHDILLDSQASGCQQVVHGFYCGEAGEKQLRITLMEPNSIYPFSQDNAVAVFGKKPDGTCFMHACEIEDGKALYTPTAQTLAVTGSVLCQLVVYGAEGKILFTPEFCIEVAQGVRDETVIESSDDFQYLDALILKANEQMRFLRDIPALTAGSNGTLLCDDMLVGSLVYTADYRELPETPNGQLAYVQRDWGDWQAGFYLRIFDVWMHLPLPEAHTHKNKALLDALSLSNFHNHANKDLLDSLCASELHTHENKELLDDIGEHIDHLYKATHTHVNKADLDIITYADVVHANRQSLDKISVSEDGKLYIDGKRLENVLVWKIQKDPVIPAEADGTLLYTVYGEDGLMESDPYIVEIQGVLYRKPAPWKPGQLWVCRGGIWYLLTSESKTNFDPSEVANGGDITIGGDEGDIEDFAPAPEPEQDEMIVDGVKLLPFGKPLDLVCDKPETAHYYLADENITTNRQYLIEVLTESANRSIRIACYNGMFSVVYEEFGEQKKYYQNGSWDSAPDLSAFEIAAVKFNGIDTVDNLDAILANPDYLKMYTSFCQAFQSCAIEDFKRYAAIDGAYEALSDTVVCDGRVYAAKLNEYTTAIQTSRDRFLGTKDSYATVYVDCDADVDVAFDADYLVGGEAPNTKAGRHKLIYNVLPDATVSLGSLDLEAVG